MAIVLTIHYLDMFHHRVRLRLMRLTNSTMYIGHEISIPDRYLYRYANLIIFLDFLLSPVQYVAKLFNPFVQTHWNSNRFRFFEYVWCSSTSSSSPRWPRLNIELHLSATRRSNFLFAFNWDSNFWLNGVVQYIRMSTRESHHCSSRAVIDGCDGRNLPNQVNEFGKQNLWTTIIGNGLIQNQSSFVDLGFTKTTLRLRVSLFAEPFEAITRHFTIANRQIDRIINYRLPWKP